MMRHDVTTSFGGMPAAERQDFREGKKKKKEKGS
jgi:hypothetical protein